MHRVKSWGALKKASRKGMRSRFGVKKTATFDGKKYDSNFESKYAQELEFRRIAGDIKSWQRQVRMDLRAHGVHICFYKIDFIITHNDDSIEYVEVKGFETDLWRFKWRLFEAQMNHEQPLAKLTVVKQR